jgi:malonyl-CoA/methylmalonyl-CoA synthetase
MSVSDPAEWIESAARSQPQRLFLKTSAGRDLSYAALHSLSGGFASALMRLGVAPGDRVVVQAEKSAEVVLLYVACLRLGAVFVPINTANTPNEVEYFLRDSQPRVAVVRPSDRAMLEPAAARAAVHHLETLGADGEGSLLEQVRHTDESRVTPQGMGRNSPAAIVYTSGTTGRSKGAILSRANLASNAAALAEAWHFTDRDILLHALPLFHIHGLFAAINTVLASGSSMVLLPKFDAGQVLKHLAQSTVFMGVPTYYTRLLQLPDLNLEATAGMRLFVSGSAPLLPETHQEFLERTGHTILERYGMTETLIEIRVVVVGGCAQPEVTGEIEVRGPNVFCGYWQDPEKTRGEFTADGWFKTGDLGRIDCDGYVHIVGRAKDLVISGGYNVYPKEVETELDALSGVLESAVFGVPHPDLGEAVAAAVVLQPAAAMTEADVIAAVRVRLARYKVPRRVLFVDELPRNTMGKVQKNLLRTAYSSLYGAAR